MAHLCFGTRARNRETFSPDNYCRRSHLVNPCYHTSYFNEFVIWSSPLWFCLNAPSEVAWVVRCCVNKSTTNVVPLKQYAIIISEFLWVRVWAWLSWVAWRAAITVGWGKELTTGKGPPASSWGCWASSAPSGLSRQPWSPPSALTTQASL